MSIRGWVYIIDNEAMPNILKIGYSTKDPILRARELAGTATPHHFRVVFDVLVEEPRIVEQAAHVILASKREGKEWFRCSQGEAIAAIRACAKTILLERNNSKEPLSSCLYYDCSNLGTLSYKGNSYCEEHYKLLRKQRFDRVRSIHKV